MSIVKDRIQISGNKIVYIPEENKMSNKNFSTIFIGATLLVGTIIPSNATMSPKPVIPLIVQGSPQASNSSVKTYSVSINDELEESKMRTLSSDSKSIGRRIIKGNIIKANIVTHNITTLGPVDLPMDSVITDRIFDNARVIKPKNIRYGMSFNS